MSSQPLPLHDTSAKDDSAIGDNDDACVSVHVGTNADDDDGVDWLARYGVGWEPVGAEPSFTLDVQLREDEFDLGSPQAQRVLATAAAKRCAEQSSKSLLAAVLMVKNESKRILTTLRSARPFCDRLVLLDTGSDDDTLDKVRLFCGESKWPLTLEERPFEDFGTSRNYLLNVAEPLAEFLLLLDCNDELENGLYLRALAASHLLQGRGLAGVVPPSLAVFDKRATAPDALWLDPHHYQRGMRIEAKQMNAAALHWPCHYFVDVEYRLGNGVTRREPMVRLVRADSGWRYSGPLHEVLWNDRWRCLQNVRVPPARFLIVQDKTADDDGSERRWPRDLQLLQAYLQRHPNHPTALYYMGKTLRAMQRYGDAARYFGARYNLVVQSRGGHDWQPLQTFNALLGFAQCTLMSSPTELDAQQQSAIERASWSAFRLQTRVEPLLLLHRLYTARGEHYQALMVAQLSLRLPYPSGTMSLVDRTAYVDERYARYAQSLLYFNNWAEAIAVLRSAMQQVSDAAERPNCKALLERIDATRQLDANERLRAAIEQQAKSVQVGIGSLQRNLPFRSTPSALPLASPGERAAASTMQNQTKGGGSFTEAIRQAVTDQVKRKVVESRQQRAVAAPAKAYGSSSGNKGSSSSGGSTGKNNSVATARQKPSISVVQQRMANR